MWRLRYSEIFISTYIPTYKGNSLRKSLHNHRCYFGFTFEVRFCPVISLICIAISEIGNANSQVGKPNALMRWFSQLISVSLGGSDANCTDNISTLQNLKKNVTANLMRHGVLQCSVHRDRDSQFQTFPLPLHVRPTFLIGNWFANLGAMMCGKVNTFVVKLVDSTARDIRPGTPKDLILISFNPETPRLSVDV